MQNVYIQAPVSLFAVVPHLRLAHFHFSTHSRNIIHSESCESAKSSFASRDDLWKINSAYVFKASWPLSNSDHVREIFSDGVVSRKCRNKATPTHIHPNPSTLTLVDPRRRANGFRLAPSIFHRSVFINHSPLSGCCSLRPSLRGPLTFPPALRLSRS